MTTALRPIILAILGALLFATAANAQDFDKGTRAYDGGDYAGALREWRPLAESGNREAQVKLGGMYLSGKGLPQDFSEGARWYRLAAEQGHALAQISLGILYAQGQGVPKDYVQAHKWYNLAAAQGEKNGIELRDLTAELFMTPAQVAEAQKLAREWSAGRK